MQKALSDLLSPHYCCSCGRIGAILCEYCKYDIVSESYDQCLICLCPTLQTQLCDNCTVPYTRAWCIGARDDALRQLLDVYKFERVRAAHKELASLLDDTIPQLPTDTIVVPVPTIAQHKRVRGYGHVELMARRFASMRNLTYYEALYRRTNTVQRGATRQKRASQAKVAYGATTVVNERYLLVDDVCTTGATLSAAAQVLVDAGATEVWVAVVSRQPLEK